MQTSKPYNLVKWILPDQDQITKKIQVVKLYGRERERADCMFLRKHMFLFKLKKEIKIINRDLTSSNNKDIIWE